MYRHILRVLYSCIFLSANALAQSSIPSLETVDLKAVEQIIMDTQPPYLNIGRCKVMRHYYNNDTLFIDLNEQASYIPYRPQRVKDIYDSLRKLYTEYGHNPKVMCIRTNDYRIEDLVPLAFGGERQRSKWSSLTTGKHRQIPLITPVDPIQTPTAALKGKHLALWRSHGYFYDNKSKKWRWQRPLMNGTIEDLLSFSYIVPYIVPMLENSGAIVLLPHERDLSSREYIIDNDAGNFVKGHYNEKNGKWETANKGFGYIKTYWEDNENPFESGTSRQTHSSTLANTEAFWGVDITHDETLAVYVSYQSFPNSVEDALYTVHHAAGTSSFRVNQTMGGGTWIYLGTFPFEKDKEKQGVSLSNISSKRGKIVSADAVKIGGGMGNTKRWTPATKIKKRRRWVTVPASPKITSGLPRYAEASRYWMQWAGVPDSIYNSFKSTDDYTDDYKCRSVWVSYLTGGTAINPNKEGLNIPIDLSLTLHTDAGLREDPEEVVGTLAIFNTKWQQGYYPSGLDRLISRELTDIVQSYIVRDVRISHNPQWTRRGMWDKNYSEATWGSVPGVLLELLSHQNFKDMCYGHDPEFKFVVSRAIYKGILRYLSDEYNQPFIVQPLPVKQFAVDIDRVEFTAHLSWQATDDPMEASAAPSHYILYTAVEDGHFDKGRIVKGNSISVPVDPGVLYRFKVVAANEGGVSFPSEELCCGIAPLSNGRVMIINGYDKVSEMEYNDIERTFVSGTGITYKEDVGIPSDSALPQRVVGNSFNYVATHGSSLLNIGYSFGSSSRTYVSSNPEILKSYAVTDLILGKQKAKQTVYPTGKQRFALFDRELREALQSFAQNGGGILVSGAYLNSALDLRDTSVESAIVKDFARQILGYEYPFPLSLFNGSKVETEHRDLLDRRTYVLKEGTDCDPILPAEGAGRILHYTEDNVSAGIFFNSQHKACVIGFPIENIEDSDSRERFLKELLPLLIKRQQ
ncbi:xanthan lyase [Porphyromonas sp.]|uniref:golvesin C-terminal-like domain-containing protein n=1 Tax=Porphyromonas sp. TaxID=1924944 RepID=UPI0026DB282A|nr:xanthan lyase [Porphyromonas sp.]MDO4695364.1 xanthan lyase [Porphyromonas sp.]MDO4770365.1 xanthan lyase [Porphyromonas sp.]